MNKEVFIKHGFIVSNKINNKYFYGYIDYLGEKILDIKYSEIIRIQDSSLNDEIYLVTVKDNKAGFYKNKQEVLKQEFEDIRI